MEDRKDKQIVQQVFDSSLSGIQDDPWMAQRVLNMAHETQGTGGIVVRKKMSVGMVIVLILILFSLTAFATVAIYQYYSQAINNEATYGAFQQWPYEKKVAFIQMLVNEGAAIDCEKVDQLMNGNLSEKEAETVADEIVIGYFGEGHDGALSAINMMERELGQFNTWTLEDKAWVSEQKVVAGDPYVSYEFHKMPDEEDMQPAEAIATAQMLLPEVYDVTLEEVKTWPVTVDFLTESVSDGIQPTYHRDVYVIALYSPESDVDPYYVKLSERGELLLLSEPVDNDTPNKEIINMTGHLDTPEEKAQFHQNIAPIIHQYVAEGKVISDFYKYLASIIYIMPSGEYISQETAQGIAEDAIKESFGWDDNMLMMYVPWVSLRGVTLDTATLGDESQLGGAVWHFKYRYDQTEKIDALYLAGEIPYGVKVTVDATSGEVVEIREYDEHEPFANMFE